MATKKQQQAFAKKVATFLLNVGAEKINIYGSYLEFKIDTEGGVLFITLHEPCKEEISSIYTRFEDVDKAKQIVPNINPYSGKWNFHNRCNDALFYHFTNELQKIGVGEVVEF